MAMSVKMITIYAKVGFILNDWLVENLPGLLDGSDLATGLTAIAGEIAGEWDLLVGMESTSSVPEKKIISQCSTTING